MKRLIILFTIFCSLTTFSQTTEEYLEAGSIKIDQKSYESLILNWEEIGNWEIALSRENELRSSTALIHSNETIDEWTEASLMIRSKGVTNEPMNQLMNSLFVEVFNHPPKAKLNFIEKDESVEYPWILFIIESYDNKDESSLVSSLFYIVKGKQALYTNFITIQRETLPEDFIEKWSAFFKTGKIVFEDDE